MGKNQIPSFWERCSTCDYWGGRREVYSFGSAVLVETSQPGGIGEKGKCYKQGSGFYNTETQHSHSLCNYYKKWGPLK